MPINGALQAAYVSRNLLGDREHSSEILPVLLKSMQGVATAKDPAREVPKPSLAQRGLLGKPTGPMLVVVGTRNSLVPITDLE